MLAAYLSQEEIPAWIDNELGLGERWEDVIVQRITNSRVVLVLMSESSRASDYVLKEIRLASELGKRVAPILLNGTPFTELEGLQRVNFFETIHTRSNFVEQLRDIVAPGMTPSSELQRRRLEDYCLVLFGTHFFADQRGTGVQVGMGLHVDRGIKPDHPLGDLDELDWGEVFSYLREKLPEKDLKFALGVDYGARFPTVNDFVNFLADELSWADIRRLAGQVGFVTH